MFNPINQQHKKINSLEALNSLKNLENKICNSSVQDFIVFAKQYNIFQESNNEFYINNCNKIRERLAKENLTEDDIRPGE